MGTYGCECYEGSVDVREDDYWVTRRHPMRGADLDRRWPPQPEDMGGRILLCRNCGRLHWFISRPEGIEHSVFVTESTRIQYNGDPNQWRPDTDDADS